MFSNPLRKNGSVSTLVLATSALALASFAGRAEATATYSTDVEASMTVSLYLAGSPIADVTPTLTLAEGTDIEIGTATNSHSTGVGSVGPGFVSGLFASATGTADAPGFSLATMGPVATEIWSFAVSNPFGAPMEADVTFDWFYDHSASITAAGEEAGTDLIISTSLVDFSGPTTDIFPSIAEDVYTNTVGSPVGFSDSGSDATTVFIPEGFDGLIQLRVSAAGRVVSPIPAPGALVILAGGMLPLSRRRRRGEA